MDKALDIITYITCSKTGLIMKDPVIILSTGQTCEKAVAHDLDEDYIENTNIKNIIDVVLKNNYELQQVQFGVKFPHFLFENDFVNDLESDDDNCMKKYVNINLLKPINGCNIISYICKNKSKEIIEYCFQNAIDINKCDRNNLRVINYICQNGSYDILKMFLERFCPLGLSLNKEDNNGETLLTYLQNESNDIDQGVRNTMKAQLLLEWGTNVNVINRYGMNAVHIAVMNGDFEMFQLYVKFNNVNFGLISPQINDYRLINYIFMNSKSSEIIKLTIEKMTSELYKENGNIMKDLFNNAHLDAKTKDKLNYEYLKKLESFGLIDGS